MADGDVRVREGPFRSPYRDRGGDSREGYRTCLGACGQSFWSQGPENRFCPSCDPKRRRASASVIPDCPVALKRLRRQ